VLLNHISHSTFFLLCPVASLPPLSLHPLPQKMPSLYMQMDANVDFNKECLGLDLSARAASTLGSGLTFNAGRAATLTSLS
jgi:hypothetical protein